MEEIPLKPRNLWYMVPLSSLQIRSTTKVVSQLNQNPETSKLVSLAPGGNFCCSCGPKKHQSVLLDDNRRKWLRSGSCCLVSNSSPYSDQGLRLKSTRPLLEFYIDHDLLNLLGMEWPVALSCAVSTIKEPCEASFHRGLYILLDTSSCLKSLTGIQQPTWKKPPHRSQLPQGAPAFQLRFEFPPHLLREGRSCILRPYFLCPFDSWMQDLGFCESCGSDRMSQRKTKQTQVVEIKTTCLQQS